MSNVIALTNETFKTEVLDATLPVVVDFWASWCTPCKMLSPIVDKTAEKFEGKVKVCKVNVDECPELAGRYQVASIPTLIAFKSGANAGQTIGLQSPEDLEAFFQNLL